MSGRCAKYDLAVAYRVCPRVSPSATGVPFAGDKYRLASICLKSFIRSVTGLRVKVWALLDGCPAEYETLFRDNVNSSDLVLMPFNSIGNRATFGKQIDVLLQQQDADLVYFAEDDYFYLPNQFAAMHEFLIAHPDADFITPIDHMDSYTLELHRKPEWIRIGASRHWRTISSSCLTFLTRKTTLAQCASTLRTYLKRNDDCAIWLSLTKGHVSNPVHVVHYVAKGVFGWKSMLKAWLYGGWQILFGRKVTLWAPIPAVATHLAPSTLSPNRDWYDLIRIYADELQDPRALAAVLDSPHANVPSLSPRA